MILRRISERDAPEAADFLDAHTMLLRWLVAFLRHLPSLPQEEEEAWSLLRGDTAAEGGLAGVFAHYFRTATTYACVAPEADLAAVERLVREDFLPERLVLEEPLLTRWKAASPALFRRAAQQKEIRVFISTPDSAGRGEPAGFRAATRCDLPVLEEQERLLEVETGQELASDLESLLEHELLFVVEQHARVTGFVRSNLSDGRFVHAGGLYVHPQHRGQGVGRALAAGLAARVGREQGLKVILDAYSDNVAALHAYAAAGYAGEAAGAELQFPEGVWGGAG
jgi:ribosomal protein S18 acetylase RimI-like enzyme